MENKLVSRLDVRIAVSAAICILTATILNALNLKFTYGEMKLEILQKMTAAITCLLCCQDDAKISWKSGVNRVIITFIGGIIAIAAVLLDGVTQNQYLFVVYAFVGILLTLILCKCAKVPYVNARIGGVTFILVACTLSGNARIWYSIFRLISTMYGVVISMLVTWVFQNIGKKTAQKA